MAADIPTTDTGRTGRQDPTDQKIDQDYPELAEWLATDLLARNGRALAVMVEAYVTAHGQGPAWLDVAVHQRPDLTGYPHWARRWYAEHLVRGLARRRWLAYGRVRADELILWAGAFPPDVDLTSMADRLADTSVTFVVGSRDELAPWAVPTRRSSGSRPRASIRE